MLRDAAQLGKVFVILNTDDFLIRKKGYVFMPLEERKEILEAISYVDRVIVSVDKDDSVCKTLEMILPDIFANGGDRTNKKEIREAELCDRLNIEMVFGVGGDKIQSSSRLVKEQGKQD
jgi:D-beta-D-heptose 7-phosphate kinase/D-beta-D-heptose 1-phosphate adenosyltransferase